MTHLDLAWLTLPHLDLAWLTLTQLDSVRLSLTKLESRVKLESNLNADKIILKLPRLLLPFPN